MHAGVTFELTTLVLDTIRFTLKRTSHDECTWHSIEVLDEGRHEEGSDCEDGEGESEGDALRVVKADEEAGGKGPISYSQDVGHKDDTIEDTSNVVYANIQLCWKFTCKQGDKNCVNLQT